MILSKNFIEKKEKISFFFCANFILVVFRSTTKQQINKIDKEENINNHNIRKIII